jgi:hypothetical protein
MSRPKFFADDFLPMDFPDGGRGIYFLSVNFSALKRHRGRELKCKRLQNDFCKYPGGYNF